MTESTPRRFPWVGAIAFGVLAAVLLTLAIASSLKGVRLAGSQAEVVEVQDGQTVVVHYDGAEQTLRLAGMLAPAVPAEDEQPTPDQCLGQEAYEYLQGLLPEGATVRLEFPDDDEGPNGTTWAQVHHTGRIVNVQMVEEGLAVPVAEQPLEDLGAELATAHEEARTTHQGLYSSRFGCTLEAQVAPVLAELDALEATAPTTSAAAQEKIGEVTELIERATATQKIINAVEEGGTTLSSLAWASEKEPLSEELEAGLAAAQEHLTTLQTTEQNLLAAEQKQREEEARRAWEEQQAELARQREIARQQEIARQEEIARQQAAAEEPSEEPEPSASASPEPSASDEESADAEADAATDEADTDATEDE